MGGQSDFGEFLALSSDSPSDVNPLRGKWYQRWDSNPHSLAESGL